MIKTILTAMGAESMGMKLLLSFITPDFHSDISLIAHEICSLKKCSGTFCFPQNLSANTWYERWPPGTTVSLIRCKNLGSDSFCH